MAKLAQIDERYTSEKEWDAFIWSGESVPVAHAELKALFATMQTMSSGLRAQTRALKPDVEVAPPSCAMRLGRHTIVLSWLVFASNFVAKSKLYVLEYDRPYFLAGGNINVPEPSVVGKYDFARNGGAYGWKSGSTFMTSSELAEWAVERLIAYLEK